MASREPQGGGAGSGAPTPGIIGSASRLLDRLREDARAAIDRDPAARSVWEVLLTYPGFHAVVCHRLAHALWVRELRVPARLLSQVGRFVTGIEIHPGASVGRRFFIDHGMGVVIGETAEIGDDVTIYQGVSLAGTSRRREKRHPTIEDGVVVGTGATVLGPVTVGRNSRIGAGSVVVRSVPAESTVVGIPGRVVEGEGVRREPGADAIALDHGNLPDPIARTISSLIERLRELEERLEALQNVRQAAEPGSEASEPSRTSSTLRRA